VPSRTRRSSVPVAIVVAVAMLLPTAFAAAQSAERGQLERARERIAEVSRELDRAEDEAGDAEVELADADQRLAEVEAVVNDVAAELDRQRNVVADAEARLAAVEEEAAGVRARLEARAASMFKQGGIRDFSVLLGSDGAEEALARSTYLRALTVADASTFEALVAVEVTVEAESERLRVEEERLQEMLVEQEALLAEVEELRSRRALAAADARARVDALSQEHDDLEEESARIEELIRQQQEEARRARQEAERRAAAEAEAAAEAAAAAERAAAERAATERAATAAPAPRSRPSPAPAPPPPSPPPSGGSSGGGGGGSSSSSGFAWPLCAPVTSEYGPRWGRMHQGIDQGASTGTPIGASKGGTVIYAGWQGGYGNLVLIDHHDGVVTAYAHQSRMAVSRGQSVSQGATIGYVGNTGNSTGPHLHFETRVNGSAVNPRQYLSGSPC
jgi:murein DD-endopeptidase MepM/ murein hydrolase activator NlpD